MGAGLLALFLCSGIPVWTLYKGREERRIVLSHADDFLRKWQLPAIAEFRNVDVLEREKSLKDYISIVLEYSSDRKLVLWHRPKYPYIVHAEIPDLDRPKLANELEAKDARKTLEQYLGKDEASRVSMTSEPSVSNVRKRDGQTDTLLVAAFYSSDGKTTNIVRFNTETGQPKQIETRLKH